MKTTEYYPVKNALLTAACWILQWEGGYFSALLMYAKMTRTGETEMVQKLPTEVLTINPVCFGAGALISILLFALIWFLLLSRTYPFWRSEKRLWLYVWRLQAAIGFAGLYIARTVAQIHMLDQTASGLPGFRPAVIRPVFAEYFAIIYCAAAVILLLLGCDAIRRSTPPGFAQSHDNEE